MKSRWLYRQLILEPIRSMSQELSQQSRIPTLMRLEINSMESRVYSIQDQLLECPLEIIPFQQKADRFLLKEVESILWLLSSVSVSPLELSVNIFNNLVIGVIIYFVCIRNRNNTPPVVYESQGGASSARQTFELTRE